CTTVMDPASTRVAEIGARTATAMPGAHGDQAGRIRNVAEGLRQLAKSENVSVLALSQLSRPKDVDINSRPNLSQLQEFGDVEEAAHVVVLIYMPMRNDVPAGEDEIIVGKTGTKEGHELTAVGSTQCKEKIGDAGENRTLSAFLESATYRKYM